MLVMNKEQRPDGRIEHTTSQNTVVMNFANRRAYMYIKY
jgi:hypothetical protein